MTFKELYPYCLEGTVFYGYPNINVYNLKSYDTAKTGEIAYILNERIGSFDELLEHPATAFLTDYPICYEEHQQLFRVRKGVLSCSRPRLQMAIISQLFDYEKQELSRGIHRSAIIEPNGVIIGIQTRIESNVTIYGGVKIGMNCIIHAGAVIGCDGFGYERDRLEPIKIAQLGGVIIGHGVEIGANACIDRGSLRDTIIGNSVKIDNLVHIAHNVEIGDGTLIVAGAVIAGGVSIGRNVWIAPCYIKENVRIGDGSVIGMGSVVLKDVPAGSTVYGVPAKERP